MAKWLWAQGANNLNTALRAASARGHLRVVEWLCARGAIDINGAFSRACAHNHLHIVKWTMDRGVYRLRDGMRSACYNVGNEDVIKWLNEQGVPLLVGWERIDAGLARIWG